jgi:heme A synthase
MTGFQRLCLLACFATLLLIAIGGVVRATDSGLGCPDWPTCHGRLIPPFEKHTLIEYSHRLTASVVGLLVLGLLVFAWRLYRHSPAILYPAILAFVLVLAQAGLGGAVVLNELPPEIVAAHLAMALALLTLLLVLTVTAFATNLQPLRLAASSSFGRIAASAWLLSLPLLLVGSYVSGAGYGLACDGWPLCNGSVLPDGGTAVQLHFLHRALALSLGVLLLGLVWLGWQKRRTAPTAAAFALAALGLYVLQALIGAANIWSRLAVEASASHLAVAALLWAALALLNIRLHALHQLLPMTSERRIRPGLVEASQ